MEYRALGGGLGQSTTHGLGYRGSDVDGWVLCWLVGFIGLLGWTGWKSGEMVYTHTATTRSWQRRLRRDHALAKRNVKGLRVSKQRDYHFSLIPITADQSW